MFLSNLASAPGLVPVREVNGSIDFTGHMRNFPELNELASLLIAALAIRMGISDAPVNLLPNVGYFRELL